MGQSESSPRSGAWPRNVSVGLARESLRTIIAGTAMDSALPAQTLKYPSRVDWSA